MPRASVLLGRAIAPLAAVIWIQCANGGTDPNLVDISGHWEFVEQFTDALHQITCVDSGGYDMVQAVDGFAGTYGQRGTCRGPGVIADNADSGQVSEGHVVGRTIRFKAPNCGYDGHLSTESDDRVTGRVVCAIGDGTTTYDFSGTWSATR